MRKVNLNDWTLFSTRLVSKSYKSNDGKLMLKVIDSTDKNKVEDLYDEQKAAAIANRLGVPTPKVGEIVEIDEKSLGLEYEYIEGKKSFSRAISENPENTELYIKEFTWLVKRFHSTEADIQLLPSFFSRVDAGLKATKIFSEQEKDYLREELAKLPQKTKCLHGDLQYSNAIRSKQGFYLIDLGMMSYGDPKFDVASFYCLAHFLNDELAKSIMRVDCETLKKHWELYAKFYYDYDDLRAIEEDLKPYIRFCNLPILAILPDAYSVVQAKDIILNK